MATATQPADVVRLPGVSDRTVIIGRTGSGKTLAGLWHLSLQPIDTMPWVVVDFKRDEAIAAIPYAQYIRIGEIPSQPGIYVVQPRPVKDDQDALNDHMGAILERGDIGIFVDEGFMMAQSDGLDTILMQGRSKHIPVIINTQRPVYVSRYVFSEASFVQVFHVLDRRDRKVISEFTPLFRDQENDALETFHSWYYDVGRDELHQFRPVPDASLSNALIAERLAPLYEVETEDGQPRKIRAFI